MMREFDRLPQGGRHLYQALVCLVMHRWRDSITEEICEAMRKALIEVLLRPHTADSVKALQTAAISGVEWFPPVAEPRGGSADLSGLQTLCLETPIFWDHASAYRKVWAAGSAYACPNADECDRIRTGCIRPGRSIDTPPYQPRMCFRRTMLGLLSLLHRRALAEVRNRVRYVSAGRVSEDLVEMLLDAALATEEIPRDLELWEAVQRPQPRMWEWEMDAYSPDSPDSPDL